MSGHLLSLSGKFSAFLADISNLAKTFSTVMSFEISSRLQTGQKHLENLQKEKMMMRTTLKAISALTLVVILMVTPVGRVRAFGQNERDGGQDLELQGTWNVTLRFPVCNVICTCPGGVPNIPIPQLNTYLKDSTLLTASGGSLFAGPGHGSWERIGYNNFKARFKFFLFNADGSRRGSEEVTKTIGFTSPDAFEAASTFDFFDAAGNLTAHACPINETANRFE